MMILKKNILFFTLFFLFELNLFCQKDSLTNKKNYFYIHVGINNSIPHNYHFIYDSQNPDDIGQNFSVFPQFSILGGDISLGFQYSIIRFNKFKFSIGPEMGIDFYHGYIVKVGTYDNGSGGIFKGGIYISNNFCNASLNIVPSLSYSLNNTTDINLYIGAGAYTNLITTVKNTEENIILNTKTNYKYTDYGSLFYYVSTFLKFEICKIIKKRKYGIFIGTTFLGKYSNSPIYSYENKIWDPAQEYAYSYFIINYGLTYKF